MPELIFPGPEGRLEGRYHPQPKSDAPLAIILHPNPQYGGTMNNRVVYNLHYAFHRMGFTVLRFNFRGVGRSQGEFDQGIGELSDAASALPGQANSSRNASRMMNAVMAASAFGLRTQRAEAMSDRAPVRDGYRGCPGTARQECASCGTPMSNRR